MWLIDENLDVRLYKVLSEFGIEARTAEFANLKGLDNGRLLRAAESKGYNTILTRDILYHQDSGFNPSLYPNIGIVVVRITVPQKQFVDWFKSEFQKTPIEPKIGQVLVWPK